MSDNVIVLICNPDLPALDAAAMARVMAAAERLAPDGMRRRTLAPGVAEEIHFPAPGVARDVAAALADALGDRPVDICVAPARGRLKRLLVADMDSTIIGQECIDELADFAGMRAKISAITERAMRGELDFEAALTERVAMLRGLSETTLLETFETRIALNPGALALVRTMQAQGASCALVSGGFTFFTQRIAAAAGFDHHEANELILEDGRLTGAVALPIKGRAAKKEALLRHAARLGVSPAAVLAVGDGANDLDMLAAAGLGVAFHAKPAVAAAAQVSLRHADLTGLLYLQGIPQADFID